MTRIEEEFFLIGRYDDWMKLKRLVAALNNFRDASIALAQKLES